LLSQNNKAWLNNLILLKHHTYVGHCPLPKVYLMYMTFLELVLHLPSGDWLPLCWWIFFYCFYIFILNWSAQDWIYKLWLL